jgi:molecular chaperone DnaJ
MRLRLKLTLEEVAFGVKKKVRVAALEPCAKCAGSGSAGSNAPSPCGTCGGAGEVRRVQRSVLGQFVSASACPTCGGEGSQVTDPCDACNGEGRTRAEKSLDVEVPPGVDSDNYLTLRGQGSVGPRGGQRGDVIVILDVEEDPRFVRDGDDLIHVLPVSFSQAALGAAIEVPTVGGAETVSVEAGAQNADIITMRGKGLPRLGGGPRGDQHVRLHIWTPTDLDAEQEELFRRLADLEGDPPARNGRQRGFWSKVKEAFAV